MSSWSSGRSFDDGQNGSSQYYSASTADAYGGGGQYEATTGGKKRQSTSRLKKSSGKKDDVDVVGYTAPAGSGAAGAYAPNASNYGGYSSGYGGYNAGSVTLYNNGATPYSGGGGYGSATGQQPTVWAPQDSTRSPMVIHTREVHVHGAGSKYDGDERRRSGGFFRPAFEAVGHFFDRRFGLHDKD
ncbi:hypothetical protein GUJ93_ZPchr0007g3040 [Zizania palustris]|uniref:Uncharacterized protein n=1 Tax=Zizania palustris TaxID=103762 RepID=A0A8J5T570_ZIZPA|nr:hypothetical protein GUJ93_ZPchr0007g3040 [Zizania palustris]